MSANSGAHSAKGGFNQSGGAYFIVMSGLETIAGTPAHTYTITTAAKGSGGATTEPVLTLANMKTIMEAGVANVDLSVAEAAAFVATGMLLKDMGKTIVSGEVTYRKFEVAATGAAFVKSNGVVGNPAAAATSNTGYGSFYLQVGREGKGAAVPAPIARYF
jgi:hypothetical protein